MNKSTCRVLALSSISCSPAIVVGAFLLCSACCGTLAFEERVCLSAHESINVAEVDTVLQTTFDIASRVHRDVADCISEIDGISLWIHPMDERCRGQLACTNSAEASTWIDVDDGAWLRLAIAHEMLHIISYECLGYAGHGDPPFCRSQKCREEPTCDRAECMILTELGALGARKKMGD